MSVSVAREVEALGHHADDVCLDAVQPHRLADDLRIAGKAALPEVVAENGDRRRAAVAIFIGCEDAAANRPNAEHVPHRRGEPHAFDALGRRAVFRRAQVHREAEIRADRVERSRLLLPRQIVRSRGAVAHRGPIHERRPQRHQAFGLVIRQVGEQRGVDQAEDGRVRADAQRQRQHRRDGESGPRQQHAGTEHEVLPESRHSDVGSGVRRTTRYLTLMPPRWLARLRGVFDTYGAADAGGGGGGTE